APESAPGDSPVGRGDGGKWGVAGSSTALTGPSPRRSGPGESHASGAVPSVASMLVLHGTFVYDGKHLPKAISNFGEPLMRMRLRSSAHSRLRSFARNPSHVSLSAVTRRSALP